MKKKNLVISIIITFCVFIIISIQYIISLDEKGGFKRKIKDLKLEFSEIAELSSSSMYFIGISDNEKKLFLKDYEHLSSVYSIDPLLSDLQKIDLSLPKDTIGNHEFSTVGVSESKKYISNNQTGSLRIFNQDNKKMDYRIPSISWIDQTNLYHNYVFSRTLSLNGTAFIRKLEKYNFLSNKLERSFTVEKLKDGVYCTDGILKMDSKNAKLFYMFFYRGEFLCLDTNMTILYRAKTIDTIKVRPIQVKKIKEKKSGSSWRKNNPILAVNRTYTIFDNSIYILSAVDADNENAQNVRNNQIVDIYNIKNGDYIYSFYIPNYRNDKVQDIKIKNNNIYGIYKRKIVRFKISSKLPS